MKRMKKIIALVLAVSFLQTQLVWAWGSRARQLIQNSKAVFQNPDKDRRPGAQDVSALMKAQAAQESLVEQKNALEGMQFSLTTQNGDILSYVGDTLTKGERPDGTELNDLQLDSNGNITDARIALTDGSVQIFDDGKILGYLRPDGTNVAYDVRTGRVNKTTAPDGTVSTYRYDLDKKKVIKTTVTTGNTVVTVFFIKSEEQTSE